MGVYIHAAWLMDPSRAGMLELPLRSWACIRHNLPAFAQRPGDPANNCCTQRMEVYSALAFPDMTDCSLNALADGMNRFIDYAMGHDNVWFATMSEVRASQGSNSRDGCPLLSGEGFAVRH